MQPLCSNCKFWHKIGEMPGRPGQWGLKMLLTKERFSQMNGELQNKLGKYKSRKYLGFMTKGKSNQVMWIGKFDKSDDDVLIRLVVSRKGGKDKVMGLYFQ